jgi:glycosyltransferase involved in cell wall biosynthesis
MTTTRATPSSSAGSPGATPARQRVLFIGSGCYWAGSAGYLVRQGLFVEALQRFAEVTPALFDVSPEQAAAAPVQLSVAHPLPMPQRRTYGRIGRWWHDATDATPRMFRGLMMNEVRQRVASLRPEAFDAVFVYRIDHAYWAGVLDHPRLLLDIDDPEHARLRRYYEQQFGVIDSRTLRDLDRLRRFERDAAARAVAAFVCQQGDAALFDRGRIEVVPNAVEVPASPRRLIDRPSVVFIGNLSGGMESPNNDAARWFVHDIWPLVRRESPNAVCRIVGRISPAMRDAIAGHDGVEIVGQADDLAEVFASCTLSIAPIRFGTGTRIKILDAMAHACPVVSTTMGADGLDVRDGVDLLLADRPDDFARQCVRLLHDAELAKRIGDNGRDVVDRRYNRSRLIEQLAGQLARCIEAMPHAECAADSATCR